MGSRDVTASSNDLIHAAKSIVDAKQHEIPGSKHVGITLNAQMLSPVQFRGDIAQLKRILSNLISNAIDAIETTGQIDVSIASDRKLLSINVRDTGRGISSAKVEQLGKAPLSFDKAQGHGLGLYHAFQTVRQFGGEIKIDSAIGTGTTISILLPLTQLPKKIEASSEVFILIDDDAMVRETWKVLAKVHGKTLSVFEDFDSFDQKLSIFTPAQTSVYIDENLGNGISGTSLVPKARALGFTKVYITTGSHSTNNESLTVFGKSPPWMRQRSVNTH